MSTVRAELRRSRQRISICHECFRRLTTASNQATSQQEANPFASYGSTTPPSIAQLQYATNLFLPRDHAKRPAHLLNAPRFLDLPPSPFPEVAIIGRSNVGKSSLLNALLGFNSTTSSKTKGGAHVSRRPGATRDMNVFGVGGVLRKNIEVTPGKNARWKLVGTEGGGGKLLVFDMPGYASGSTEIQGKEMMKYLSGRKQLRCVFVLVDARHGMKSSDKHVLSLLWQQGTPHQLVLSKVDYVAMPRARKSPNWERLNERFAEMRKIASDFYAELKDRRRRSGAEASGDILSTSSEKTWPPESGRRLGVDGLRWGMLQAVGLDSDARGRKRDMDFDILANDEESESSATPTNSHVTVP